MNEWRNHNMFCMQLKLKPPFRKLYVQADFAWEWKRNSVPWANNSFISPVYYPLIVVNNSSWKNLQSTIPIFSMWLFFLIQFKSCSCFQYVCMTALYNARYNTFFVNSCKCVTPFIPNTITNARTSLWKFRFLCTHLILFICVEEEFFSFFASIWITYAAITKLICGKQTEEQKEVQAAEWNSLPV